MSSRILVLSCDFHVKPLIRHKEPGPKQAFSRHHSPLPCSPIPCRGLLLCFSIKPDLVTFTKKRARAIKTMCTVTLPVELHVHRVCAWPLQRPEESAGSPEAGVTDGWELPCGCWNRIQPNPQQKQHVLLITEPSR